MKTHLFLNGFFNLGFLLFKACEFGNNSDIKYLLGSGYLISNTSSIVRHWIPVALNNNIPIEIFLNKLRLIRSFKFSSLNALISFCFFIFKHYSHKSFFKSGIFSF